MHDYGLLKLLRQSLALSLVSITASADVECKSLVATGNPEYPPYLWRDPNDPRRLIGANADLLKRLAQTVGIAVEVIYTGPWSRAQEEVRTGRIDMIAGAFLTLPRLQLMDYVQPPFLFTSSVVWVRQGEDFQYGKWTDLEGHSGGTLVNNSHGQQFDEYAKAHLHLEEVPSLKQAFQKLLLGRNDYVIYEQYPGLAYAKKLHVEAKLEILAPPISSEGLYFTLSHKSACNTPELKEKLEEGVAKIISSDLPEQLLQRNLALWKSYQKE